LPYVAIFVLIAYVRSIVKAVGSAYYTPRTYIVKLCTYALIICIRAKGETMCYMICKDTILDR